MTQIFRVETIVEDPCCSWPVQGPSMKVSATIEHGGVGLEFHLPAGHIRLTPGVKTLFVPIGEKPSYEEISRLVHHCLAEEDLMSLLRAIADRFGFRESWVPRELFRKEIAQTLPPAAAN